jgi:hypothetical protein
MSTTTLSRQTLDWSTNRQQLRNEARDALIFAQAKMSIYYHKKHLPVTFAPGDKVFF